MLDVEGFVAETDATHLFFVKAGVVQTPTTRAAPEGITRAAVLELCDRHAIPCRVRDLQPADIAAADEIFCTGTMGELVPVTRIDGRAVRPGPVFARLAECFSSMTADPAEGWLIGDIRA
jgi:branched-chain amino acid aminotransferase